ncbi:MAG: aspartate kinase, partial [Woeseiaceae bacterium]
MGHTVEKIGGTSMADTRAVLDNVLIGDRNEDELYDRIFVVSAYAGITNRLLEHKEDGQPGVYALFADAESEWAWGDALSAVAQAMLAKNAEIFSDDGHRQTADRFVRDRVEGVRSCLIDLHRLCSYGHFNLPEHLHTVREMLASLGEAHSAHNTALLLNAHGINARFIDLTGWRDGSQREMDERITAALADIDVNRTLPIVTGYAHSNGGVVHRYGRGYSELTFSRIAVLTGAAEAIIHKEFHLSSADPAIVGEDRVKVIGQTNYDVADQLANMGMEAIHPGAARGLRQAGIPLRVKNTFDPSDAGTVISGDYVSRSPRVEIVTGIRGVYALEFFEQDMVGVKGYDATILEALKRHRVRVITKTSNANTIIHYLAGSPKAVRRVINELEGRFDSADISTRKVSIVSAIGSDLNVKGLTGTTVAALTRAGIEILGVHQLLRNVDIMLIVNEGDYLKAVDALHAVLVERRGSAQPVADDAKT